MNLCFAFEIMVKKNSYICIATLVACVLFSSMIRADDTVASISELENATYSGLEDGPVSLLDGRWEGEPYVEGGASRPTAGLLDSVYYTGDIDGDGAQEAVVVLWTSGGGTGEYTYVMVMARENGEIRNIGSALIGDRVTIKNGKIADKKIILDVLQAGENDPMCCPSMLATRTWSLQNGQLVEDEIQ